MTLRSILLLAFLAVPLAAQDTPPGGDIRPSVEDVKPEHDPKAVAAFNAMMGKVYRPRDDGLRRLRFKFHLVVEQAGETQIGETYSVDWTPDSLVVCDPTGKDIGEPSDFILRIVREQVGYVPFEHVKKYHIRLDDKDPATVRIDVPEWFPREGFVYQLISPDDQGRCNKQLVIGRNDKPLARTLYRYTTLDDRTLVAGKKVDAFQSADFTYTYKRHGSFTFIDRRTTTTFHASQTLIYSDLDPNPTDAPPTKTPKKPTPPKPDKPGDKPAPKNPRDGNDEN